MNGKERVLEIHFTDLDHTYQIRLNKTGSQIFTDGSLSPTTHIDTPFSVWSAISRGEIGGAEALGKQMYTVSGDFSLMINWDKFFGSTSTVKNTEKKSPNMMEKKRPSMMTMLIPWIAFWIAVSITPKVGALITLIVVAGIPFIMRNHELRSGINLYDSRCCTFRSSKCNRKWRYSYKYRISCVWIVLAAFMPDKKNLYALLM